MSSKPYYDKYFPAGTQAGTWSENHMLNVWLFEEVTQEMLESIGLEAESDESDGDFEVQEDGRCVVVLSCPLAFEQSGLPPGFQDELPTLLGLKSEWIKAVTLDG